MKPIVTILIDTYNYGMFIDDAIQSALDQIFPVKEMEIIVVDDGSTDDTPERVKKYKDKVRYIYKKNGGQASAFNVGVKNARGEYIVLCDSDDYLFPERVQRVVEEFERYKDVVCVLNARRLMENDRILKDESYTEIHNLELNDKNIELLIESSYGTSRSAFRKTALEKIFPIPEEGLRIEADLYLNLVAHWLGNISCLNQVLTYYRIHGKNLFHLMNYDNLPSQINAMKSALKFVRETVMSFQREDAYLLDKILLPYEIEIREKEFELAAYEKRAKRRNLLSIEIDKFRLHSKRWTILYKLYKLITIPFMVILPPRILLKLRKFLWEKRYYQLRKKVFP